MDLINGTSVFDFDVTKLSIYTLGNGLAGIEVYDLLRDEYDIQIEFGDICNILAYISIGDRLQDIERLVGALADIERLYKKDSTGMLSGNISHLQWWCLHSRHFMRRKNLCPWNRRQAGSAVNLLCVILRES